MCDVAVTSKLALVELFKVPSVLTLITPPDIINVPRLFMNNLPATLMMPPCISKNANSVPPPLFISKELPVLAPKLATPPDVTRSNPLNVVEKFPVLSVAPFTHTPPVAGMVGPVTPAN